jgi:hypothetical protein
MFFVQRKPQTRNNKIRRASQPLSRATPSAAINIKNTKKTQAVRPVQVPAAAATSEQ